MKNEIIPFVLVSLLLLPISGRSEETPLKPWVPLTQQTLTVGSVAVGVVTQIPKSQAAAIPLVHFSTSQPAYALNHLKGEFGERMMDVVFTNRLLRTTGGWSLATPARIGRTGIDGLYFKTDSVGNFHDLLVADAKYGSARLGMTSVGKQMSDAWIKQRLEQTARMYRSLASEIETGKVASAGGIAKNAASNRVSIPLNDKTNIELWRTRDGLRYFCADKTVSTAEIQRQLKGAVQYLDEAAAGNARYRPRLFSYSTLGKEHIFTIRTLDADANVVTSRRVQGTFDRLPVEFQKTVQSQVRRTLLAAGKSREEIHRLTREICDAPVKFNQVCMQPRHSFLAGLDGGALKMAGVVGVAAMGIDAAAQYWENGKVDVQRLLTMGALAGGSTVVGNYAGTQASLLLASYSPMLGQYGGAIFGGGIGAAVFSYGLYFAGYSDIQTAHTNAIAGAGSLVVGSVAYYGAISYAMAYGTASTGTAISSLSGAAATNAAFAWWGGGSLAAGGSGVAGGATVLTGGTAVVVIVAAVAFERSAHYARYFKDEANKQRYLATIVDYTLSRVREGKQQEWR